MTAKRGRADLEQAFEVAIGAGLEDHAARALVNLAGTTMELHDYPHAATWWRWVGYRHAEVTPQYRGHPPGGPGTVLVHGDNEAVLEALVCMVFLRTTPAWTTVTTFSGLPRRVMSASGSPSHTTRSAILPACIVPSSSARPSSSAAARVPATMASAGLMPRSTRCSSSRRFWPWGPTAASVPSAILTPRWMAWLMFWRVMSAQRSFFS